jgi:hypothetical protein
MTTSYHRCTCPHCNQDLEYPGELVSQEITCPLCAQPMTLPAAVTVEAPPTRSFLFGLFKKEKAKPSDGKTKPYNWKKEHTRLWNDLVPPDGQADTLQGELIRIAGKLTDQAFRNGNMNWDEDHEKMWRFVGKHLDDPQTFNESERQLIRDKIEEITSGGLVHGAPRTHSTPKGP